MAIEIIGPAGARYRIKANKKVRKITASSLSTYNSKFCLLTIGNFLDIFD